MGFLKKLERSVKKGLFGPGPERPYGLSDVDPSTVQWDPETGLPIGLSGPPNQKWANQYQWKANELAAKRNAALRRSADAFLDQGFRTSEGYRPGGFASFDWFRQRANLALASQIEAPDLMAGYRENAAYRAAKSRQRAGRLQFFAGIAKAGIGAMAGNPLAAAGGVGDMMAGQQAAMGAEGYGERIEGLGGYGAQGWTLGGGGGVG